jgi:hypothetical protein
MSDVQPWELHSELVFVSPEVSRRAREELPERDPDAFLARPPAVAEAPAGEPSAGKAAVRYSVWRLGQAARFGLVLVAIVVVLALLAELLH